MSQDVAYIVNRHGQVVDVPAHRVEDILSVVKGARAATADEIPGPSRTGGSRKAADK